MICGTDEAGRGPIVGPLVVAGINVENDLELVKRGGTAQARTFLVNLLNGFRSWESEIICDQ